MSAIQPSDILVRVTAKPRYGVMTRRLTGIARGGEQLQETVARADATMCATLIGADGKLYMAGANKPRISWVDLNADGIYETPTLLLEGSRTNSILQSQALATTWAPTAITPTNNSAASPDGTVTATLLVPSVANSLHYVSQGVTITANENVAASIYLKAKEYSGFALVVSDAGVANGFRVGIDLLAGTLNIAARNFGTGTYIGASVTALAGGWYRITVSGSIQSGVTAATMFCEVFDTGAHANTQTAFAGDAVSGLYAWGAQLERASAFASSYIKTVAATVTRAADSLTVPIPFGLQDCTVLMTIARPVWADAIGSIGYFPVLWSLGTGTPRVDFAADITVRQFYSEIKDGVANPSVSQAIPAGASIPLCGQFHLFGTGAKTKLDVGSGFTGDSAAAAVFAALSNQTLRIGDQAGANPLFGGVIDLFVVNGLHTLAECQAVP